MSHINDRQYQKPKTPFNPRTAFAKAEAARLDLERGKASKFGGEPDDRKRAA